MGSATLLLVHAGERVVCTYADDVIHMTDELWREITAPVEADRPRRPGEPDVADDCVEFGVEGEGLGRLRYRLIGHDQVSGARILRREHPG